MSQPRHVRTWAPQLKVGSYTLLRELARGGMGEIWLARQQGAADFERLAVLKRVISGTDEEAAHTVFFLDEARIAAQLQHPNLVHVYEFSEDQGSYFMAMEFLPGHNLARVLRRFRQLGRALPRTLAAQAIAEAARGLGYAHRRQSADGASLQIVHRDISPHNLFVTFEGHIKVLDFGIGKMVGRRAQTTGDGIRGKVEYISPEQATGAKVSAAADVFSLGVVLFELLTSQPLHDGLGAGAIIHRLASGQSLLPSATVTGDRALDAILTRALAWNPFDRFADAQAMFEALDSWLRGQAQTSSWATLMGDAFGYELAAVSELAQAPVEAATRVESKPRPSTKGRFGVFLIGAAALLAAAVVTATAARRRSERQPVPAQTLSPLPSATQDDAARVTLDAGVSAAPAAVQVPEQALAIDAGRPPRKPVLSKKGLLTLETDPWARVYLGRQFLGETPLIQIAVPVGPVRLRLVNEPAQLDRYVEFEVESEGVTVKKLVF